MDKIKLAKNEYDIQKTIYTTENLAKSIRVGDEEVTLLHFKWGLPANGI